MEHKRQHPITQDIPLPGHYSCLTMQLNVTMYQSPGTIRLVCVVREPSDQIELSREIIPVQPYDLVQPDRLGAIVAQQVSNMAYLMWGNRET